MALTLAAEEWETIPEFKKINSLVRKGNGRSHAVLGFLSTDVNYRFQEKLLKLFVIPSIKKPLILGIHFWKEFKLAPRLTSALPIEEALDIKG